MSVKSWVGLLLAYSSYLLVGGLMFQHLECGAEIKRNEDGNLERIELNKKIDVINEQLLPEYQILLNKTLAQFFKYPESFQGRPESHCIKWSYYNSFFFSFTIVSTIGYGHQFPATDNGRWACIIYALIGIPLNAIIIGALGSVYHNWFKTMSKAWKGHSEESDDGTNIVVALVLKGFLYLLFFTSIFLFLPAKLLQQMESRKHWDYTSSFYFTFVTLSTIGFGDMVAGDADENEDAVWDLEKTAYRIFIILWIIFGMGYVWGVVEIISDTLKKSGKPVVKIWRKIFEELNEEKGKNKESGYEDTIEMMQKVLEKQNNRLSWSLNDLEQKKRKVDIDSSKEMMEELGRDSIRSLKDYFEMMPKLGNLQSQMSLRQKGSSQMFHMRKKSRSRQDVTNVQVEMLNPLTEICQARTEKATRFSLHQESKGKKLSGRFSDIPYQDLLKQTTLKDFMTALDIVNNETEKERL